MKVIDIAKKNNLDAKEFEEFVVRDSRIRTSGTTEAEIDYSDVDYAVNLYLQNGGKKADKEPVDVSDNNASHKEKKVPDVNNKELLEQIAKDVKKASFWIRFWSILSLISGIIVAIILIANEL